MNYYEPTNVVQYYQEPSTESMQSLVAFQWYFCSRKNNPHIYMEWQKTPNSQSNPEKEEQSWRLSHALILNYITKL